MKEKEAIRDFIVNKTNSSKIPQKIGVMKRKQIMWNKETTVFLF